MLRGLLEIYEVLCKQVRTTDRMVKEIVSSDEDCALLKSIPGIGEFFAVLIKTEIGDIERFSSSSKLCSYAGIVPSMFCFRWNRTIWHGKLRWNAEEACRWQTREGNIHLK